MLVYKANVVGIEKASHLYQGFVLVELLSIVEREVPCYELGSLNQVDTYFVQDHVVFLLALTLSVTGRTLSFY